MRACGRLLLLLFLNILFFTSMWVAPPPPRARVNQPGPARRAARRESASPMHQLIHASLTDNRFSMISHITHVYAMSSFDHGW